MLNKVNGDYFCHLTVMVMATFILLSPKALLSQGYFKAELRNTNCTVASHEADRWFFGQNASLDFRQQDPVADAENYYLNVYNSPAIMADSNGNILFFTEGAKVYDRSGQVMPNGNGLHGFPGYTMPVLIVPKPGSDSIYYIFTTYYSRGNADDTTSILYGFECNEVNLNRNGGLGDITLKNIELLSPEVSSKLTAVKHSNGVDYWVVAHKFDSDEFCSFRVTSNGVDPDYVSSFAGTAHTVADTLNGISYMKFSPDGTKLALALYGSDIYEIFDFDADRGEITLLDTSPAVFEKAFGIEFSSDSRYLYATTLPTELFGPYNPSYIFQFDDSLGSSIFDAGAYDTIAADTLGRYFGGMQLGTDGKIYVSRFPNGNAALSVIQNPKRKGPACNDTINALSLAGKKSRLGFPNFVQSYFDLPHFDVENICFSDTTIFILQNNANIDSVSWKFGDPGSNADSSAELRPSHVFSGPGSFQVKVTEYYQGIAYGPYTETVIVNELPPLNVENTVYMYPGAPVQLDAGEGYVSYEWSTGENTQKIIVSDTGTYYVKVQNDRCCFNVASVLVIYFDVYVPNAFRPGGSNSIFKALVAAPLAVNNFTMYIYNRWGQQIFVSYDIEQGWDGKINGKDAPGDVYVWLITYTIEREGRAQKITYKGNVILLR